MIKGNMKDYEVGGENEWGREGENKNKIQALNKIKHRKYLTLKRENEFEKVGNRKEH